MFIAARAGLRHATPDAEANTEQASGVLNEIFHQITHDLVAEVHRNEKIARMRSAVVDARQKAEREALKLRDGSAGKAVPKPGDPDARVEPKLLAKVRIETDAAIFKDGKAYLKGNPLKTQKEILCPDCRLPRLLYPIDGIGARPPPDPNREYCQNRPLVKKPGFDVQGNPFAIDKPPSKKKKKVTVDTPASSPPGSPEDQTDEVLFPTAKCPNCPRYFTVTRVAYHLDRCQGISGRASARNRTPQDGMATPVGTAAKRSFADDDDISSVITKKKKLNAPKKNYSKKLKGSSKLKNGITPDTLAAEDAPAAVAVDDDDDKSDSYGDIEA